MGDRILQTRTGPRALLGFAIAFRGAPCNANNGAPVVRDDVIGLGMILNGGGAPGGLMFPRQVGTDGKPLK